MVGFVEQEATSRDLVAVAPATSFAYALYTRHRPSFHRSAISMTGFSPQLPQSTGIHLLPARWDSPGAYGSSDNRVATRGDLAWLGDTLRDQNPRRLFLVGCDIDLEPRLLAEAASKAGYVLISQRNFDGSTATFKRYDPKCAVSTWRRGLGTRLEPPNHLILPPKWPSVMPLTTS